MIAIKDMTMPPNCLECPLIQFEYGSNTTLIICEPLQKYIIYESRLLELLNTQRMIDCPLVEVEEE